MQIDVDTEIVVLFVDSGLTQSIDGVPPLLPPPGDTYVKLWSAIKGRRPLNTVIVVLPAEPDGIVNVSLFEV